jgi:REP element-mobilizing transposase RayT
MATPSSDGKRDYLRRLDRSFYTGQSYVHWTMTMADRATGWLSAEHHVEFRQLLFHALARYRLACPVYCLMPDHAHLLLIGLSPRSDQIRALAMLRRDWNQLLAPAKLQKQPYDHVLREADRERGAFATLVGYILRNPVRASLVAQWTDWPYGACCFPGYPKLDPRQVYFWDNFWKAAQEQSS